MWEFPGFSSIIYNTRVLWIEFTPSGDGILKGSCFEKPRQACLPEAGTIINSWAAAGIARVTRATVTWLEILLMLNCSPGDHRNGTSFSTSAICLRQHLRTLQKATCGLTWVLYPMHVKGIIMRSRHNIYIYQATCTCMAMSGTTEGFS